MRSTYGHELDQLHNWDYLRGQGEGPYISSKRLSQASVYQLMPARVHLLALETVTGVFIL